MKILLIKTSSIGDIVHTFPAVTDAAQAFPGLRLDWVVENAFEAMPLWHPAVGRVIPVGWRRWRRQPLRGLMSGAFAQFRQELRAERYEAVIDAQGLLKSAAIALQARGVVHGPDRASARESLAAMAYRRRHSAPVNEHAIERVRGLFAAALGYSRPQLAPAYGLDRARLSASPLREPYLVFFHGTAWRSKEWPLENWRALASMAGQAGFAVALHAHGEAELEKVAAIARDFSHVHSFADLGLEGVAALVAGAAGTVGVDTGLSHLAAALDVPGIGIYGPTNPARHGVIGRRQINLGGSDAGRSHRRGSQDDRATSRVTPEAAWRALGSLGVAGG